MTKIDPDYFDLQIYAIYRALWERWGDEAWHVVWHSGEVLFDELRLAPGKKMKTGAYGTGADVLESLAALGHGRRRVPVSVRQPDLARGVGRAPGRVCGQEKSGAACHRLQHQPGGHCLPHDLPGYHPLRPGKPRQHLRRLPGFPSPTGAVPPQ